MWCGNSCILADEIRYFCWSQEVSRQNWKLVQNDIHAQHSTRKFPSIMKRVFPILFALLGFIATSKAQENTRQAIIASIFEKMELQGVDTEKPLLYGYFFYDKSRQKLEKFANQLKGDKYHVVRLELTDTDNYILHVEKVETHSRSSLLKTENQFDQLCKAFQIDNFDGWDIGNADPRKPLVSDEGFEKYIAGKSNQQLYEIANKLYASEINDKAALSFQRCIDRKYRLDTCHFKQGVSLIAIGEMQKGIEQLQEAVHLNPQYFKAWYNLGASFYENQEYQKSIDCYQRASKIDNTDDNVYYGIAASQYVLENPMAAKLNCQKALEINPSNSNAKSLLARINEGR